MVAIDSDYKAYGSFAPVYTDAIDRLYDCLPVTEARQAEKVLRAYVEHASNIGTCYPGIDRLKERTHYSETIIKRCWKWLGELDYIRVHREYSPARQKTTETFQVSPYVMWIKPDHIHEAALLWGSTSLRCNEIIHGQPTPESRIRNQHQNQLHSTSSMNHHHHQKTTDDEPMPAPGEPQRVAPPTNPPGDSTPQRRQAPNNKAQAENPPDHNQRSASNQIPAPGSEPPPPQRRDYTTFVHPLPDASQEDLAQRVRMGGTHIHVARALIADYGYDLVLTTWQYVEQQVYENRCRNPIGLLVFRLKSGSVEPGEKIGVAAWLDRQANRNGKQE